MNSIERLEIRICSIFAAITLVLAAIIYFTFSHSREIENIWVFVFKLTPYFTALTAIAYLPKDWWINKKIERLFIPGIFLIVFCFFVPKIFFSADNFPDMYFYMLVMTPFLMLSFMLCYRLGGGDREMIFRIGIAMMLLMLSGLEDLAFVTLNDHTDPRWNPIPEVWDTPHIEVFFGRPPTKNEVYAFIAIHVTLAAIVLFFPFRRLFAGAKSS